MLLLVDLYYTFNSQSHPPKKPPATLKLGTLFRIQKSDHYVSLLGVCDFFHILPVSISYQPYCRDKKNVQSVGQCSFPILCGTDKLYNLLVIACRHRLLLTLYLTLQLLYYKLDVLIHTFPPFNSDN